MVKNPRTFSSFYHVRHHPSCETKGARTPAISITRPHPSVEDVPETKAQQEKQGYANVVSSYLRSGMRTKGLGNTTESHIENSIAIKAHEFWGNIKERR